MGSFVKANGRVWLDTYNWPRKFDNGVVWVRLHVRLRRWHRLGGLWVSSHWPFLRPISPWSTPKGRGPIDYLAQEAEAEFWSNGDDEATDEEWDAFYA